MRIGAVLSPVGDWAAIEEAAKAADELGFAAVGLWDHYHSAQPEWAYVCGWSAYGALAARTTRVRLVPMVLNSLHYELGVLAKESSVLSLLSGGRFELGIGAGDWPDSFAAWGRPFPARDERVARLAEMVLVLRRLWSGEPVTHEGTFHQLRDACCVPVPSAEPRVVVGVGGSPTMLLAALAYADEVNVYSSLFEEARTAVAGAGRPIDVSLFLSWEWDQWPSDPVAELASWRDRGAERVFISLGGADMPDRLRQLAPLV
jgi:alkanesulfonate monooxygenase SsuD/methylene tetrahydromethanopterin reductase-like flavin-dependent oxidoreductase (luciferase family)